MRLLAVLALGFALVSAGCLGGDDEPTPPTTSTPVTTTPAPGTGGTGNGTGTGGSGTGNGTGTGGGSTTPPPKAPAEVLNDPAADFTKAPTPPATESIQAKPFTVPGGYTKLALTVNWTTTGPAIIQSGVVVNILAPDGSVAATCAGPGNGPAPAAPPGCLNEGTALPAGGEYTAQYKGSGNLKASVVVVVS